MLKIIILDFSICEVFIYPLTEKECREAEAFMLTKGHDHDDCQWMIAKEIIIND